MFENKNQQSNQDSTINSGQSKQLSGNKDQVEDILADSDTSSGNSIENLLKNSVPAQKNENLERVASLKDTPVVPSMKKSNTFNESEQDEKEKNITNNIDTSPLPVQTIGSQKNKLFLIIMSVLVVVVLILASIFIYQYFTKDKNSDQQFQNGQESLQKLINSLDQEKDKENKSATEENSSENKKTPPIKEDENKNNTSTKDNLPLNKDSDGDGLTDNIEDQLGTDKNKFDTDGDGLNDFEEVQIYFSDANNPDTDGDGYLDGEEVQHGYSPLKGDGAKL